MSRPSYSEIIHSIARRHEPIVEPPSAELEENALREFGDQDRTAVQAIFHARRDERWLRFHVEPVIAAFHGLSQRAMTKAMDRLEGRLIETIYKERGKPRRIRLLPDWENPEALEGDITLKYLRAFAKAVAAQGGFKRRSEFEHYLYSDFANPPEALAELRKRLEPDKAQNLRRLSLRDRHNPNSQNSTEKSEGATSEKDEGP